ncbi:NACHT domain-containing protein [Micromonospora sp. CPCC 205556]|uniref:NACHT domain-containing protein n=1 Tax=Micromonospora sp. CPCC 205556 TaxID=3122398 RepID=UPI002FF359A3
MKLSDNGHEFEQRALAIARAIYDPSHTQGAVMFRGREHDGVFMDDKSIVAFEFTVSQEKAKAVKDAEKIKDVLQHLIAQPENYYKMAQGFVVTASEPTAEQRQAVDRVAGHARLPIKCLSLVSLRRLLIDTEKYLALRRDAPFGSSGYQLPAVNATLSLYRTTYVEPTLVRRVDGGCVSISEVMDASNQGQRIVITADYGSGKSEALRQLFERMRKKYFKAPSEHRFPLHLNLRDGYGLRTPREVLWRHAEDIGFNEPNSLVAAWRAGNCTLLLDGFDELVPSRWVGGARDLKQVRWQALEAVRRLIAETPDECGIVLAGRPQYFSSPGELLESLALERGQLFELQDFNDEQIFSLLGTEIALPEWIPAKPLLLKFLIQNDLIGQVADQSKSVFSAWWRVLDLVAAREADRLSSVTRESIRALIARTATLARGAEEDLGTISIDDMRSAFREVCGYEADEEGLQLLLRLPGLASMPNDGAPGKAAEGRRFVDSSLAAAAYGLDLSAYISSPYSGHPLSGGVTWTSNLGRLASGVAAIDLEEAGFDPGVTSAVISKRMNEGHFDAVLLDVVLAADFMAVNPQAELAPFIDGVLIPEVLLPAEKGYLSGSTFKSCVIEVVDATEVDGESDIPTFQDCLIGRLDGWSQVPDQLQGHFSGSDIVEMSSPANTTAGILQLQIGAGERLALVVLKKVYAGSGRKESALVRGVPLVDRAAVPQVTASLLSAGYIARASGKGDDLILPVKSRRAAVARFLAAPQTFNLANLR